MLRFLQKVDFRKRRRFSSTLDWTRFKVFNRICGRVNSNAPCIYIYILEMGKSYIYVQFFLFSFLLGVVKQFEDFLIFIPCDRKKRQIRNTIYVFLSSYVLQNWIRDRQLLLITNKCRLDALEFQPKATFFFSLERQMPLLFANFWDFNSAG